MAARKKKTKPGVPVQTARTTTQTLSADPETTGSENVRTSIMLPRALDENLSLYTLRNRASKSEIIAKLLVEFLTQEGYQPLKRPKLEVKY